MNTIEIAQVKDNILKFLSENNPTWQSTDRTSSTLKLSHIPKRVLVGYLADMQDDDVIRIHGDPAPDMLFSITPTGEKFLYEGGYTLRHEQEAKLIAQNEKDEELNRTKTRFELTSLRIQTWVSIGAIVLSVAALLVSIFKD